MMPWTETDAPEAVQNLPPEQRAAWVRYANEADANGYDEVSAAAIAHTAVKQMQTGDGMEPHLILDYPLERPGRYVAAVGGDFELTPDDVQNTGRAIGILYSKGKPVTLIDGHGSGDYLGFIPAARQDGDVLRGALVLRDWYMWSGIKAGAFGLSQEANIDYASEAYTDGETFKYWPTAWAVLPAGEQPAIPPGEPIAAAEAPRPVRLYAAEQAPAGGNSPTGKGDEAMEELTAKLEQLEAAQQESANRIAALESENGELKEKLAASDQERDQLKAAQEKAALEAEEAAVDKGLETVMAAAVPGVKERMTEKLAAAEGLEQKKALLGAWEPLVDKTELDAARLQAREQKHSPAEKGDAVDKHLAAAEKLQVEKGIPYLQALELVKGND